MSASCQTCRFAQFYPGAGALGRCRIKPPTLWVADGEDNSDWPRIAYDDWCGEHQPVKPDAAASIETMAPMLEPFLAVADAMEAESAAMLIALDLRDANGEALELSSADFANLAAAWEAVRRA